MDYLNGIAEIKSLLEDADYTGIQVFETDDDLEPFLTKIFSYRPTMIRWLYRLRAPLVRLLGFKQAPLPEMDEWIPAEFPMYACEMVWFFTVQAVDRDQFWIAGCPQDRHLDADLAVVARPLQNRRKRFYLITTVQYKHWTGLLYFNLIRLFNLILVNRMAHFAVRQSRNREAPKEPAHGSRSDPS